MCVCECECGCAAGLACLSYLRIYLGSFDRIPSNCVINVFTTLPVGGAASSSMLLCTLGVTDVRRNVWVLRSLLTVSAEPCHSAPLHPPTPPLPTSSTYTSASPPAEAAGWEAKWCETGELPDKLHYSSSENSPQPACQRRVDGPGPGGSIKAGAKRCLSFTGCISRFYVAF